MGGGGCEGTDRIVSRVATSRTAGLVGVRLVTSSTILVVTGIHRVYRTRSVARGKR